MTQTRWQEIQSIWTDNRWLYVIAGILIGIVSVPAIEQVTGDLNNLIGGLVPETIGIIFTVLILNTAAENRAQQALKDQLYSDLHSVSNDAVITSLHRLREKRWLNNDYPKDKDLTRANWERTYIGGINFDNAVLNGVNFEHATSDDNEGTNPTSFKGAWLNEANLQGSELWFVNLQGAKLWLANLQGANLQKSHLEGAEFDRANLQGADLKTSNVQGADFQEANLQGAFLSSSNFQGASLRLANLSGARLGKTRLEGASLWKANLENVKWDTLSGKNPAILPDGTTWTPDEDMGRFTNPEHEKYEVTLEAINAIRIELGYDPLK
ncbi:MAG: hypothetical protein Phog2KO_19590 [Phototrophicaceae bacterium]